MSNFIQSCLNGDAFIEDIDDYIDQWHQGDSSLSLHTFLGMSEPEYHRWIKDPDTLPYIIKARKDNTTVEDTYREEYRMAARSGDVAKSNQLKQWLKDEGLWTD